ncbi:hypothetical protein BOTBODRAFT_35159 [Botryobasidium botryosum FD-172 SS1]|uniref:Peptidase C14 caspase domain-containing protein n=1 Tax=Botryobasidium botryosum (strain FD-172 SS1) TaxID=930990 RepID=A0A067M831_BOTB1|nr:hypothetical protein BOTBODRAFT_35159 [Botryobasidium botryosum FD-172 SS1]
MAQSHPAPTLLSSNVIGIHPAMYSGFSWVDGGIRTTVAHARAICSYAGGLARINKRTIKPVLTGWPSTSANVQLRRNMEPKRRALIIGINYPNSSRSEKDRVCDRCPDYDSYRRTHIDAQRMRDLLTTQYGYAEGHIRVLLDDDNGDDSTLQPTKATVEASLRWLIEDASPGDHYFLYFAGHGEYDDADMDEIDGKDEDHNRYVDQAIANSLLQSVTRSMPAGSQLIALFDCCHSGTAIDSTNGPEMTKVFASESDSYIYTADPQTFVVSQHPPRDLIGAPHSSGEIITISGCLNSKLAYETMGGWLTDSFLKSLQTKPQQTCREIFSGTSTHLNYFAKRINQLQAEKVFPPQTIYLHSQRPLDLDRTFVP